MTAGGVELAIGGLVLDGIDLPPEQAVAFGSQVEAELRRLLAGGGGAGAAGPDVGRELQPLMLADPPDVSALARAVAERILAESSAAGGWDG